jgi:hypothetical protein
MNLSSDALVEILRFAVHNLYDWSKLQRVSKQWHKCCRIPRALASVAVPLDDLSKMGFPLCNMIHSVEHVLTRSQDLHSTTDLCALHNLPLKVFFINARHVEWSQVAQLAQLHTLHIWNIDVNLDGMFRSAEFARLQDLEIRKCQQFTRRSLQVIKRFEHLERLSLQAVHVNTQALQAIGELTNLKSLQISDTNLQDLDWIAPLQQLHTLSLSGCSNIHSLKALHYMTSLKALNLDRCAGLLFAALTLPHLSSLWQLEEFSASGWFTTRGLDMLMQLRRLKRVSLPNCKFDREVRRQFTTWCRKMKVQCEL